MKENLEILTFVMALIVPIVGGLWFIWTRRQSSIQENYQILAKHWSNEGSINSEEPVYVHLKLTLNHGELYGLISSNASGENHDVNVTPGWFSSKLVIRGSYGEGIAVIKITGNRNRLQWLSKDVPPGYQLPKCTELWPLGPDL